MRTICVVLGILSLLASAVTQGTAFTYQGYLRQGGTPANANHDFQFSLWTTVSGGSQVGATQTLTNVPVQNGLFTVSLDFGTVWDGSDRYLQIAVRPAGSGSYTTLSPRVKINPTPYAIRAGTASPIGAAGGDLSGSYPNPTVTRLQGRSVSNAAPSSGQVLKWDGSAWAPAADIGLTLPFSGVASVSGATFQVANTAASGATYGGWFESTGTSGVGVYGRVAATTGTTYGVYGESRSTSGRGVYGWAAATTGTTYGVYGESRSTSGRGVFGLATATNGTTFGVYGQSSSPDGRGVYGWAIATTGTTYGVYGQSESTQGFGGYFVGKGADAVYVQNTGSGRGLRVVASLDTALWAQTATGFAGVDGRSARSDGGIGVFGHATATTGETYGVYGRSDSPTGRGVYGWASATSGVNYGVYGQSESTQGFGGYFVGRGSDAVYIQNIGSGRGLQVAATADTALWAQTVTGFAGVDGRSARSNGGVGVFGHATATRGETNGVYGRSDSADGAGVYGLAAATSGSTYGGRFVSSSTLGTGVYGVATATSGLNSGVRGETNGSDSSCFGVIGVAPSGGAGCAVFAFGTFVAAGTKSFQIDHPLSPETHYLNHFCAEGPEPYNFYRGTVVLDAKGEAWVQLPDYFGAINRDPSYHLTPVGAPMPNLHVAVKVQNNRFKIAGGAPGKEVSWRVEAVRNDPWVQRYGYQTVQEKENEIKGKYLHPELHGQPKEKGIHYRPEPERTRNETSKP
jgi:hypothetical protein